MGQSLPVTDNLFDRLEGSKSLSMIDSDSAFGERVSKSDGSFSFNVPILNIPGNAGMDIKVSYTLKAHPGELILWQFEEDLPFIGGNFSASAGWTSRAGGTNRCSSTGAPTSVRPDNGRPDWFQPDEYWTGYELNVPDKAGGFIDAISGNLPSWGPTNGGPYQWSNNQNWFFSCIPLLEGAGEGFLGHSPDGRKYHFNRMRVHRELVTLDKYAWTGQDIDLARNEVRIYAGRIEDRFGNFIEDLVASDGRAVTRDVNGTVTTYTYAGKQWVVNTAHPFTVTYPDGSQWKATASQLFGSAGSSEVSCSGPNGTPTGIMANTNAPAQTVTIEAPSGATGVFQYKRIAIGYSEVQPSCYPVDNFSGAPYYLHQLVNPMSLVSRTITGPGLPASSMTISYGPPNGCIFGGSGSSGCTASSPKTRTVTYTKSSGDYTVYTFGNRFLVDADLLLKVEEGSPSTGVMRTTSFEYARLPAVGFLIVSGMASLYSPNHYYRVVQTARVVTQNGKRFTWRVDATCGPGTELCFDEFGRPTKVVRGSTVAP
jgi:hypothetical protein